MQNDKRELLKKIKEELKEKIEDLEKEAKEKNWNTQYFQKDDIGSLVYVDEWGIVEDVDFDN